MKVLEKKGFKLPYVDSLTYKQLMQLGLRYDKQLRSYNAEELEESKTNSALELLSRILHEPVCFEQSNENDRKYVTNQTCVICGKSFPCGECRYLELCKTKNLPSRCVCSKCLEEEKILSAQ